MNRLKPMIFLFLFIIAASMVIIPTVFATLYGHSEPGQVLIPQKEEQTLKIDPNHPIPIKVYRTKTKTVETYPLEEYVRGVLAAEMPVSFELEALKAQALAARTYIVKRLVNQDFSDVPQGAMVTDTVKHQVFLSDQELQDRFGLAYEEHTAKLNQAVNETSGQVITYNGQPITALFFSTSNGYTENSEDYWSKQVPYLRSVDSPWDKMSPKFQQATAVAFQEIKAKLKVDPAVLTSTGQQWIKILETTDSRRVKKVRVGDKVLTGRELREVFDLPSSSFTWDVQGNQVVFHTKGYGHGVGMSQYGADGMAKQGKTAEEIVKHYYQDVSIKNVMNWVQ